MNTSHSFQRLTILHSATCFLNSLFREWNAYTVETSDLGEHIVIPLKNKRSILIPIKKYSILGRHQYQGQFYLNFNDELSEISFQEMVQLLCDFLKDCFQLEHEKMEIFKNRVFSSFYNMHSSLEFRANSIREFEHSDFNFKDSEQALIIGHNFHPTPKSRDEFNDQDMLHYSPEFSGIFCLDWFVAVPSIVSQKCAASFAEQKWTEELFLQDFAQTQSVQDLLAKSMIPIPMHPWQLKNLTQIPLIQQYIEKGSLIYVGKSKLNWNPTSSLRTVYRDESPYMLKFSMSLKMTNSIRILLDHEIARGLLLHDVLSTENGQRFLDEHPNFKIITEPASICLKDTDGNPINESIVVCRENPFCGQAALGKVMLATLIQDDPLGGKNLLQKLISKMVSQDSIHVRLKNWFSAYLNIAMKPLFIAYANYGVVMEAHQQNLILDIKDGFPVAAYFRDCQDHAYSELGHLLFATEVPGISKDAGSVVHEQVASRFFAYQVILNSTFNVITSLAASNEIDERELLNDLREFLEGIREMGVRDPLCLNYLLDEQKLMHKGNFLYSLKGVNDNHVAKDPLSLYTPVENLILKNCKKLKHNIKPKPLPGILYQHYFPSIQKTISLRTLDISDDLERFHEWQNQPRVSCFWELNHSCKELRTYLEKGQKDPYQIQVIIEFNGEPAGYCEIYWAAEDRIAHHYEFEPYDRGFHLLIGEKKFLGVENTTAVFRSIMNFLYLDDTRTTRIVVEPKRDNEKFIKYTRMIPSWSFVKEFDFPEKRAALIMSHREQFFREGRL